MNQTIESSTNQLKEEVKENNKKEEDKEKFCPKCDGEMYRRGLVSFWVNIDAEGIPEDGAEADDKVSDAMKYTDKWQWKCYNCDYSEEMK